MLQDFLLEQDLDPMKFQFLQFFFVSVLQEWQVQLQDWADWHLPVWQKLPILLEGPKQHQAYSHCLFSFLSALLSSFFVAYLTTFKILQASSGNDLYQPQANNSTHMKKTCTSRMRSTTLFSCSGLH